MKDFSTWILTMSSILCSQVMCLSDYEVVHTSELTSDPGYHHDDYSEDSAKEKEFDLSGFKRISPTPKFTTSHLYISPENAEPHFTRSGSKSNGGYNDGYSAFLQNNFHDNDDDEDVNSKYSENNYDDYEEDVNSKIRQENVDDDDDEEEVNSNYQHVPKDVEGNEHYSYNGDELDRIKSLPQKNEGESKQDSKNCKVIVKGKAMCTLCKDPVSGAHSESCSFSSAAPEKKYAYIEKAKYIS